jgi:ubiquitin-protein ligase
VDLWDMWSPANSLTNLVMSAIRLIDSDPGDHNCCNYEWTQQYHHNREIFYKTAFLLTLSYERPRY